MNKSTGSRSPGLFAELSPAVQWGFLLVSSVPLAALLELAALPAALLLGPMLAGIIVGSNGGIIRLPRLPVYAAQTTVGCLVARAITGDIIVRFLKEWPLFLSVIIAIVVACSSLGWLLAKRRVLPGTTAIWGTAPGGASVMMLMAGEFGADTRLVALMQYLRVVMVAAVASAVARLWLGPTNLVVQHAAWFPTIPWIDFAVTLAIAAIGGVIGIRLRVPAGGMLIPMLIGAVCEAVGLVVITLPQWLLALSYAFLGWSVGLGFTRDILIHATRAFPQIMFAIFAIIGTCGAFAFLLVKAAGVDPMTAYLATCPGGVNSIAIISASSHADLSFVMTMQTLRLVIVLVAGPSIARFISKNLT